MTRAALVLVVVACQQNAGVSSTGSNAPPPPPRDASGVVLEDAFGVGAIGPYVVAYNCFHSNAPFSKGSQVFNRTYDLGTRKLTVVKYELAGDSTDAKLTKPPVVTTIDPERAAAIGAAVAKVLAGGHFEPEYPVPEGTPCKLVISANGTQLFAIDKAYTKQADAVSALVQAL